MAKNTEPNKKPQRCPYCGQALLDRQATRRLQVAQAKENRKVNAEIDRRVAQMLAERRQEVEEELLAKHARRTRALEGTIGVLRAQNEGLQRRVEKLSTNDRGAFNEDEIIAQLARTFHEDKIIKRGKGGDILHTVQYEVGGRRQTAGLIVYECKDRLRWESGFLRQVRDAGRLHATTHLILVTTAMPRGEKGLFVRDGVVVVGPSQVVHVADVIRRMAVEVHRSGLSAEARTEKNHQLYEYMTSNAFRQSFDSVVHSGEELAVMLRDEKASHERVWKRRERAYEELGRRTAAIDEAVCAIIEGQETRRGSPMKLLLPAAVRQAPGSG